MPEATFVGGISSTKVAKNAKGEYSWEIKIYYDNAVDEIDVTDKIQRIDKDLKRRFGG